MPEFIALALRVLFWAITHKNNSAVTYTASAAPKCRSLLMFSVISTASCTEVRPTVDFLRVFYSDPAEFQLATHNSYITTQNLYPQNFTLVFSAIEPGALKFCNTPSSDKSFPDLRI
ncbi:MAG: hypothetical protein WBA89_29810 [Microcoleus sp.]|uniref:hypothetical protein n=1 Tax=Microcoleus sp. TaxID=44472 RepID=UPI003C774B46